MLASANLVLRSTKRTNMNINRPLRVAIVIALFAAVTSVLYYVDVFNVAGQRVRLFSSQPPPRHHHSKPHLLPSAVLQVSDSGYNSTEGSQSFTTILPSSHSSPLSCPSDSSNNFTKNFVYLIEAESCIPERLLLPSVLGDPAACNCDVVTLGFKAKCERKYSPHIRHIFYKSTWTTGREFLYNSTVEAGKKYMYYLFMDDDLTMKVYRGDTKRNAWRTFENFLLRYRPPLGIVDTETWWYVKKIEKMRKQKGCQRKDLEENVAAMYWDAMFNTFHYVAVKSVLEPIFPFWAKFDSVSWYYSNWYVCVMADVVFHHNNAYNSDVIGGNLQHRPYPRSHWDSKIVSKVFADIQSLIPEEFKEKGKAVLEEWRTSDLDARRNNTYNYCLDKLPKSCLQPFQYST